MKSDIRVCSAWETDHERPVYTLGDACPECGADAVNSAPAPFNPEDPYGEYRRRARVRDRDGDADGDDSHDGNLDDHVDPNADGDDHGDRDDR